MWKENKVECFDKLSFLEKSSDFFKVHFWLAAISMNENLACGVGPFVAYHKRFLSIMSAR